MIIHSSSDNYQISGPAGTNLEVLDIEQLDDNEPFVDFTGTSAADQTKSISTVNGDGAVTGPKDFVAAAGWAFVGMIRVAINNVDYWMPFYEPDLA